MPGTGCLIILIVIGLGAALPIALESFNSSRRVATQRAQEAALAAIPKMTIGFASDPTGAAVEVDGVRKGITAVDIEVPEEQEAAG